MKKYLCVFFLAGFIISGASAQVTTVQNIDARNTLNLDGRWHYIVDPYETGNGNFYKNQHQQSKSDLVEYDFSQSPTINVPGDWNSQSDQLLFYEGTVWYEHDFNVDVYKRQCF